MLKIILVLILVVGIFIQFILPRFITQLRISDLEEKKALLHKLKSKFKFHSFDNKILTGEIHFSKTKEAKGTIILLHGIRSGKMIFTFISKFLNQNGFNTVALDLRAHNESQGRFCTFGVKEKIDVHVLLNYLEKEYELKDNIGIWGKSLGAAVALQTMEIDDRIQFGIIESTFTDFRQIVHDYFKRNTGFDIYPLTEYLIYRSGKISDFNPDLSKPNKSCKNINQPILVVHGGKDKRIKIEYGKANFKALKNPLNEFLEIKDANHVNLWEVGGQNYLNEVLKFILKVSKDSEIEKITA
ncbi:alpha/beta hydrolase [Aureivirga marina]|uniref:alpha/beta hydrolase n=1 Tax=Aureivirga marina TaxID=1182451 RepID=UPI0018CBBCCC|nr:alpha/beta fold hydrolase [Aureivirga marina]